MKSLKIILSSAILLLAFSCKKEAVENKTDQTPAETTENKVSNQKIVSLNGGITEILAALGHQQEIVGTDVTSVYPENLKQTAKVLGHMRTITIEPIMALNPTLIMASGKDMNPELLKKIGESKIQTEVYNQEFSVEGTKRLIEQVAKTVGNTDYQNLYKKIDEDLAKVQPLSQKPKVLFIYARGNNLMVSGKDTQMASLINIAGGENAINDFDGFKPLTPEALVKYNPDFLLFFTDGLQSSGGIDGVLKVPGISQTTAGKKKQIIAMDGGLMSSFGPRLGEAAYSLNQLLIEGHK